MYFLDAIYQYKLKRNAVKDNAVPPGLEVEDIENVQPLTGAGFS